MLTRQQLDKMKCQKPGCNCNSRTIFFDQDCHPGSGSIISYDKDTGNLVIQCWECETVIDEVSVGAGPS